MSLTAVVPNINKNPKNPINTYIHSPHFHKDVSCTVHVDKVLAGH